MKESGRPMVKVCGITNIEDATLSMELGADIIGVILDRETRRGGSPGLIKEVESAGGTACAVYTSMDQVRSSPLYESVAQLHFNFRDADREYLTGCGIQVIGVTGSGLSVDPRARAEFLFKSDFLFVLIDYRKGAIHHISDLKQFSGNPHLGVAGKISTGDLEAILALNPGLIDVSSSLERYPGRKDPEKLKAFFSRLEGLSHVTAR